MPRPRGPLVLSACIALLAVVRPAAACDICAVYTGFQLQATEKGFRLGLAEQYTRFATLQLDDVVVPNPYSERMETSITQLLFGYQFHRRFGAQIVVPVISRSYRRLVSIGAISGRATVESGDVSGFGDLTLLANALLYDYTSENTLALLTLLGGLKLPSGSTSQLASEVPGPAPGTAGDLRDRLDEFPGFRAAHGGGGAHDPNLPSGIHGHDLTLGTGSVDGVFGLRAFGYWDRFYVDAFVQYLLRGRGAYQYEYGDLLMAAAGPGYFVLSEDDYTLGLQGLVTVETKGKDDLAGQPVDDTAFTGLYAGPAIVGTWSTHLSADFAVDVPVVQNNTGLQLVPDWRLRLGVLWRF